METQQKMRIHPLAAGAAVAVIIASGVGIAAMTGHLPGSSAEPSTVAQYSPAPESPVAAAPVESAEHRAARDQGAREEAARQDAREDAERQDAREDAERDRLRQQKTAAAPQQPLAQATNCATCGVVESVNAYQQHPSKSVAGMVGGGTKTVTYAEQPGFSVGSHVRVENGKLVQS